MEMLSKFRLRQGFGSDLPTRLPGMRLVNFAVGALSDSSGSNWHLMLACLDYEEGGY